MLQSSKNIVKIQKFLEKMNIVKSDNMDRKKKLENSFIICHGVMLGRGAKQREERSCEQHTTPLFNSVT